MKSVPIEHRELGDTGVPTRQRSRGHPSYMAEVPEMLCLRCCVLLYTGKQCSDVHISARAKKTGTSAQSDGIDRDL